MGAIVTWEIMHSHYPIMVIVQMVLHIIFVGECNFLSNLTMVKIFKLTSVQISEREVLYGLMILFTIQLNMAHGGLETGIIMMSFILIDIFMLENIQFFYMDKKVVVMVI